MYKDDVNNMCYNGQDDEANMVFVEYYGEGSPVMKGTNPVPFIHGTW